ncbi:LIM domain and actin-binding protein 1 [Aphelenchoides bicaudatus]|nr:LIM domain and actin-binding protein 1 [Aphelenchoides bicaudatus]
MSDNEDPYAVSSDSEDEDKRKPPPKINIEGRTAADFQQLKQSLVDQKQDTKNDATREEIESLRQANAEAMAQKKRDFEAGKSSLKDDDQEGGKQLEGVGKENMSSMKQMFEKQQGSGGEFTSEQREEVGVLKRSEAERKKILAAFMEEEAKEPPRNCHICDKIVYPVERIVAAKNTYHNVCFKCCKCSKKLTPTTFNSHEGQLFCRAHYNEAVHPELIGSLVNADAEDEYERDDDEFALVSKPKQLASDVVRAGDQTSIGDELAMLRSLKEKKDELEQQANAGADDGSDERKKELEAITGQAHSIMNRWKTGDVEKAETKEFSAKDEIEELRRGGTKVTDRFREGAHDEEVHKTFDKSELDTSAIAEARRSFLEGSAFQSGPVEKTATDLDEIKRGNLSSFKDRFEKGLVDEEGHGKTAIDLDIQLKSIKDSLGKFNDESQMTPEERTEKKKKEIEEEFLRYKLARKLQDRRQKEEDYQTETADTSNKLDVEIKMAGKARERFHELEAQGQQGVPLPGQFQKASSPSKWDKKEGSTAEVVNRRVQEDSEPEDEEFDVKHLMNKFKNIAESAPSHMHKKLEELEALRVEAKNLRQRFEQAGGDEDAEAEQKRRDLEAEFATLKAERERAHAELEAERAADEAARQADRDEDVQIAADHASKMAAKFEKINKKEAKKAEKMKMPQRN